MCPPQNSFQRPSIQDIRQIFPNANAVGMILPAIGQGLAIGFNARADLCRELKIDEPSCIVKHDAFFELTQIFGFVVLKNCMVPPMPDENPLSMSHGTDSDGRFIQDPFHYDVAPSHRPDLPEKYMSGIYKKSSDAREEDTVYAREVDVKKAILQKLEQEILNDDVRDALNDMVKDDYHFRLFHPDETPARKVIQVQYPEFVEDIFALIPDGQKYRQRWLKDQWEIFIFSNIFGDGLHARATGHMMARGEDRHNPLGGLYLVKE